jgi:Tripartite tricarboxylate transporter TctB family
MIKAAKWQLRAAAGELVVPVLMLLCVAAYWVDAAGLSAAALSFPLALTAVLAVAVAAIAAGAFLSARAETDRPAAPKTDRGLTVKTWTIVLLPVPLIFFWRELGAIAVFFLYAGCVLFVLGERRWWLLFFLPGALAFGLVYLFKTGLYVRLPDIPAIFAG